MKRIDYTEYSYVLMAYDCTIQISDEDYQKLIISKEIKIEDIVSNYNDIEYGGSEVLGDTISDSTFELIDWEE